MVTGIKGFPGLGFSKSDIGNKAVETITDAGVQKAATDIPPAETTTAVDSNGIEGTYKIQDTVAPSPSPLPAEGMSKQTKIIIGVSAGLLAVGAIIYFVKRGKGK